MTSQTTAFWLLLPYAAYSMVALGVVLACWRLLRRRIIDAFTRMSPQHQPRDGAIRSCISVALTVLALFASLELVATIGFMFGFSLGLWQVAAAGFVAFALLVACVRALVPYLCRWRATCAFGACAVAILIAGVLIAGQFHDVSWDGNWFHQPVALSLAEGWNPIHDPAAKTAGVGSWRPDIATGGVWESAVTHYPKGVWIRRAALYRVTGDLRRAKGGNIVLLVVQFLVWLAVALRFIRGPVWRALLASTLIAANPIVLVQALSHKIDGQVGSLFSIAIGLGCLLVAGEGGWPALAALLATMLMLVSAKFTGLAYGVMIAVGIAAALHFRPRTALNTRVARRFVGAGLVAVCLVACFPYVQNIVDHGAPFHPLTGKDKIDIVSSQSPVNFKGANRVERLFMSLFSRATDLAAAEPGGDVATLKIPFTMSSSELRAYLGFDTHVAGFGPLFGGALVLSLLLLVSLAVRLVRARESVVVAGLLVVALVLATVLANPEAWWARWAPQIWLIPTVLVGIGLAVRGHRVAETLALGIAGVLLVNVGLVGAVNFANVVNARQEIDAALDEIEYWPQPVVLDQGAFDVSWTKFESRGITWRLLEGSGQSLHGGITIPYLTTTAYPRQ